MGLLKRLTNGLSSRREEEPARLQPAQPREPKLRQPAPDARRLASQEFRLYTNRDVVGVEMAGALKNVMAIAAGLSDSLGLGDNARAPDAATESYAGRRSA